MSNIKSRLIKAAEYSISRIDDRRYYIGSLGVRNDGAHCFSRNSKAEAQKPQIHAEARLCKKLDVGSIIYVARIGRGNFEWALARPCPSCLRQLKAKGVKKIYYTIAPYEYGVIDVKRVKMPKKPTGVRLKNFEVGRWNRGSSAWE